LMICSAECRFLAMFSCLPKCVYSAILSHKEWTSFWGAGQWYVRISHKDWLFSCFEFVGGRLKLFLEKHDNAT